MINIELIKICEECDKLASISGLYIDDKTSEEEDFRMLDLLRNGYSYEEVAKKLNRTVEGCKGRHRYKYRWKL